MQLQIATPNGTKFPDSNYSRLKTIMDKFSRRPRCHKFAIIRFNFCIDNVAHIIMLHKGPCLSEPALHASTFGLIPWRYSCDTQVILVRYLSISSSEHREKWTRLPFYRTQVQNQAITSRTHAERLNMKVRIMLQFLS